MNTENTNITNNVNGKSRLSLMFALVLTVMLAFSTSQAFAKGYKNTSYSGPGPALVTVEQAKTMNDDARVALKGHIIQSLGGKDYVFKDATGTITVEISNKRWPDQNISPDDLVEIHGKVDKHFSKLEIDVKRIIKQ